MKNEINDGEARPLTGTPPPVPAPSDVFINSSQIQLVGLFVRRVSLSSPFHPSSILSFPDLSLPLSSLPVSRVSSPSSRENENGQRGRRKKKFPPASQRDTRDMYSRETINFLMVPPPFPEMIFVNDPISKSSSYSTRKTECIDRIFYPYKKYRVESIRASIKSIIRFGNTGMLISVRDRRVLNRS